MAQSTQAVTYAEPVAQTHTQVQQGRSPRLVSTDFMQGGACMWALQTLWPACQCVGCMPHTLHAMLGRRAAPPTSASNAERHNDDRDGAACRLIDADSWLDFDRRQPGAFARAVGPGARVQGALANVAGVAHGAGAGFGAQKSAESSTSFRPTSLT